MRGVRKTLIAAIAALLIAIGLAACGGGGDDSSSTAGAAATQAEGGSSEGGSSQSSGKEGAGTQGEDASGRSGSGGKSGAGGAGGSSGSNGSADNSGGSGSGGSKGSAKKASEFVPKQHSDSGGGSTQYKTKGGDNSIQEYGSEASGSEFEGPSAALHNFLDARAQENWAAACEYTAKAMQESLQKLAAQAKPGADTSCGGILAALVNPEAIQQMKAEAEEADVRSVRVEGERAFVIYTASEGTVYSMPMVSESGAWKVSSLAGSPIG